ncbi:MAG: carboxymuconolactone decarboxylase family protein [Gemmatimonadales bacterium]|jgi:AhpD family alkylhydroperoxidase
MTHATIAPRAMPARLEYQSAAREGLEAFMKLGEYVDSSGLEQEILDLVQLRSSHLNGCAYCIDMHTKDMQEHGESTERIAGLSNWKLAPFYTDRERAALAWTDAVTNVQDGHVSDEVYAEVRPFFDEKEIVDLTLAVLSINGWNRLVAAFRSVPGTYKPSR